MSNIKKYIEDLVETDDYAYEEYRKDPSNVYAEMVSKARDIACDTLDHSIYNISKNNMAELTWWLLYDNEYNVESIRKLWEKNERYSLDYASLLRFFYYACEKNGYEFDELIK